MQFPGNAEHEGFGRSVSGKNAVCPSKICPIRSNSSLYHVSIATRASYPRPSSHVRLSESQGTTCMICPFEKKLHGPGLGWTFLLQIHQVAVQLRAFCDRPLPFLLGTNAGSSSGRKGGRRDSANRVSSPFLVEGEYRPRRETWEWAGEMQTGGSRWLRQFLASAPSSPP